MQRSLLKRRLSVAAVGALALGVAVSASSGAQDEKPASDAQQAEAKDALETGVLKSDPCACALTEAGERIQFRLLLRVDAGQTWSTTEYPLPEGKRLLIDHVSGDIRLPVDERGVVYLSLGPSTGGYTGPVTHYFPLVPAGANISVGPQATSYFFGQTTKLFADGKVDVILSRGPTPSPMTEAAGGFVSISGRLVDQP